MLRTFPDEFGIVPDCEKYPNEATGRTDRRAGGTVITKDCDSPQRRGNSAVPFVEGDAEQTTRTIASKPPTRRGPYPELISIRRRMRRVSSLQKRKLRR
jgi:hypothetical protein